MTADFSKSQMTEEPPLTLRSEDEIIASWKCHFDKPLVSISCTTYNQVSYIEGALVSFLKQETDFPIEILVHDDASTDGTTEIIKKYEKLYPKLVKPIYQTENQYSKGIRVMPVNAQRALGRYIAICEGDDYWCDLKKLQKQYEIMERNPDVALCFTRAYSGTDESDWTLTANYGDSLSLIPIEQIIPKSGSSMPTATLFFRTEKLPLMKSILDYKPPVGDYFIQMIGSVPYGALYLPSVTAFYRRNAINSWSSKQKRLKAEELLDSRERFLRAFNSMRSIIGDVAPRYFEEKVAKRTYATLKALFLGGYYQEFKVLSKECFFRERLSKKERVIILILSYRILFSISRYFLKK